MNAPGDPTNASPARRAPTLRPIVWADVTNTVASSGTTGVQRASKNLLAPLADRDPRLDLRLIRWCPECAAFLRLDDDERRRFSDDAPPPDRRVDRLPQLIRSVARRVADRPLLRRLNEAMRRRRRPPHPVDAHAGLTVRIDDGTFLDLDAAWHNPLDRRDLLPALSAAGVRASWRATASGSVFSSGAVKPAGRPPRAASSRLPGPDQVSWRPFSKYATRNCASFSRLRRSPSPSLTKASTGTVFAPS